MVGFLSGASLERPLTMENTVVTGTGEDSEPHFGQLPLGLFARRF